MRAARVPPPGVATFGISSRLPILGISSKYFKNATNPKGEALFDFNLGGLEFDALNFDYLVIAGARAQFRGFGKLNGYAGYNFIFTAIDGQLNGGGGLDEVRIKIWNKSTGATVYDSQPGASDAADPTTVVGSGSNVMIKTTNTAASPAVAMEAASDGQAPSTEDAAGALTPRAFFLGPVRPNPLRGAADFQYALPDQAQVELGLYTVQGRRVRMLVEGEQSAGFKSVRVDGRALDPGVYFLRLRATGANGQQFQDSRKLQNRQRAMASRRTTSPPGHRRRTK